MGNYSVQLINQELKIHKVVNYLPTPETKKETEIILSWKFNGVGMLPPSFSAR